MAVTPDRVQIGTSSDYLDGVSVDTEAGNGLFRETVVLADPEDGGGLANVRLLSEPITGNERGIITHSVIQGFSTAHGGEYHDVKVTPSGALTVEAQVVGTVSIAGQVQIAEPVEVEGTVELGTATIDALTTGGGLTDAQLRASPVGVADDYQTGEILPDQTGANDVLTFTFSEPVQNLWVYAIADDPDVSGEVRVDPFGGTPSASLGIPVAYGGITPIPTTATIVRVFAATGIRVTVYGNRRG